MSKRHVLSFVALGLVAGCGSSTGESVGAGVPLTSPLATTARFSGSVRDEAGVPQQAEIVLQERITNAQVKATSAADGSFSVNLPTGVYDLGLNQDSPQTCTCYFGPVVVQGDSQRELTLKSSLGHQPGEVFGRLQLQSGFALAAQKVVLERAFGETLPIADDVPPVPPARVELTTDATGAFKAQMDPESGLDIDVYQKDGTVDEHIDIVTLSKPCYVEFLTEQSPVENRLESGQDDEVPEEPVAARETSNRLAKGFKAQYYFYPRQDSGEVILFNGVLEPSNLAHLFPSIISEGYSELPPLQKRFLEEKVFGSIDQSLPGIRLRHDAGAWFYKYRVNIFAKMGQWELDDAEGDRYELTLFRAGWHYVDYNSNLPNLVRIGFVAIRNLD